eukprot:1777654-Rhodomonas_salina.1
MEGAFLCAVEHPPGQRRLSSKGIRRAQTSVGSMLTSLVRDGLRLSGAGEAGACDGVMLDAGAIRRGFDYPDSYPHFTYGDLKKEVRPRPPLPARCPRSPTSLGAGRAGEGVRGRRRAGRAGAVLVGGGGGQPPRRPPQRRRRLLPPARLLRPSRGLGRCAPILFGSRAQR